MKPYRRKLSAEDVETGSILIEKSWWKRFPPPLEEFGVRVSGQPFVTTIVAEDCDCIGEPHQHYHLEAGHFAHLLDFSRGATVVIEPSPGAYMIANG